MDETNWEPLFAVQVRRKKELRRVKHSWGPFSIEYIPWARLTNLEKATCALLVIAFVCLPLGVFLL